VYVDVEAPQYIPANEPRIFSPLLAADVVDVDDVRQLLKQAFSTYPTDSQPPPGFDEYCRALVGRCLFLVQQWDIRKSSDVVRTIFDFFASRNLSHLYNEKTDSSPRFLNALQDNPSLEIEPQDRCFHIFLKLVASLIKRMVQAGAVGPIRNMIVRTMPNHNRMYSRDQAIEKRDLAALRNHHDLLCTLFWAAPPKLRPSLKTIENLVSPVNSHTEACLIGLRAWNQLARFVVSTGGDLATLQPFGAWQVCMFKQILSQYDSVAAEVQQQSLAQAKYFDHIISDSFIRDTIDNNKRALFAVLHGSVTASLDVIGHARTLETAQFAANIWQLQSVFRRFVRSPPEFEWRVLQPALACLDRFLDIIHGHAPEHLGAIHEVEHAISDLHHGIAVPFFSMARHLAGTEDYPGLSARESAIRDVCVWQSISIAARLTLRFAQAGVLSLSQSFMRGKYSVFSAPPSELSLAERKYLPLFVSVLLERGQANVGDLGVSLMEIWLVSIVKPSKYFLCEKSLGENLQRQMCCFVPPLHGYARSSYESSSHLFRFAVSFMRRTLREADSTRGKRLCAEYAGMLRDLMQLLKADLRVLAGDPQEHAPYVGFVREIIGLMRSHVSDVCPIDVFFLQINPEYSPATDDPRLQVAGMASYGLRLGEGDSRAANELFYYLYNCLKKSISQDRLADEVRTLRKGMRAAGILGFVLGQLLPAVLRAAFESPGAYLLLDVYGESIQLLLTGSVVPPEIPKEDLVHVVDMYRTVLALLKGLGGPGQDGFGCNQALTFRRLVSVLNSFWPTLQMVPSMAVPPEFVSDLWEAIESFADFASEAAPYLTLYLPDKCHEISLGEMLRGLDPFSLCQDPAPNRQVAAFTAYIVDDVGKNWICTGHTIAIRAPGAQQGLNGARRVIPPLAVTVAEFHEQLAAWNRWWGKMQRSGYEASFEARARTWEDGIVVVF